MPFSQKKLLAFFAVINSIVFCTSTRDIERQDYEKLKTAILKIARQKIPEKNEIETLRAIELKTEKMKTIRENCYLAYYKIFLAAKKSEEASELISEIEKEIAKSNLSNNLIQRKEKAQNLIAESNLLIEEAKELKNLCHGQLIKFEYSDRRNRQ